MALLGYSQSRRISNRLRNSQSNLIELTRPEERVDECCHGNRRRRDCIHKFSAITHAFIELQQYGGVSRRMKSRKCSDILRALKVRLKYDESDDESENGYDVEHSSLKGS